MQKVFRHTVLAERQVARRAARKADANLRAKWKNDREQNAYHRRDETKTIKEARFARREDYELGPLAPRRDVGDKADTYGTINSNRMRGRVLHGDEKSEILDFWGGRFLNIVKGDRVVILEGRDKGKIGVIRDIDRTRAECIVTGLNMMDINVPQYMITPEETDQRPFRPYEQPVSLKSVRLVVPMFDKETGVKRDVIVKEVTRNLRPTFDRSGKATWLRNIAGMKYVINWPRKPEPTVPEAYAADTLRDVVERQTFVPSLLTPPMPSSVIDELRNRYSVFRTRHEPEYIEKKQKEEDEKLEKKKMAKKMRTPLKDANRKARKERRKLGKGELKKGMLKNIGMVMAGDGHLLSGTTGVPKEVAEPLAA